MCNQVKDYFKVIGSNGVMSRERQTSFHNSLLESEW